MGNLPIGQGLSVTPIQMATAYSAIANGGILRPPRLDRARGRRARPEPRGHADHQPRPTPRSSATMLEGVLAPGGTASEVSVPGYTLAGKTGTAQKVVNGTYSDTQFVASFVGFAPAQNPKLLVAIVADDPQRASYYGGTVAAPAFGEIAKFALPYLGIPPDVDLSAHGAQARFSPAPRRSSCAGDRRRRGHRPGLRQPRRRRGRHPLLLRPRRAQRRARLRAGGGRGRRGRAGGRAAARARRAAGGRRRARGRRWRRRRRGSSATRPTSCASPGSRGRTARRRPRSSSATSSSAPARRRGLLGTVKRVVGGVEEEVERTTPEAIDLQRDLPRACSMRGDGPARWRSRRTRSRSSGSSGVHFAVAAFTNLTQDHLDFHSDMEDYFAAKRRLFGLGPDAVADPAICVVNVDDPYGARLAGELTDAGAASLMTVSVGGDPDAVASRRGRRVRRGRRAFTVVAGDRETPGRLPLPGDFNVANALVAAAAAAALGVELADAIAALARRAAGARAARARDAGQRFAVLVDYAHTPDSLETCSRPPGG